MRNKCGLGITIKELISAGRTFGIAAEGMLEELRKIIYKENEMKNIIQNLLRDRDDKIREYESLSTSIDGLQEVILKQQHKLPGILKQVESLNKAIKTLENVEKVVKSD